VDHAAILDKVVDLISETLECDKSTLDEGAKFEDLGADSFDLLELLTAFEDEFNLTMEDDALEGIKTVGDAVAAIENAQ
jgi:acyl carrier protein